ncbi:nardilysin [Trichogramma pretiosum]|uniref:nardilysin n=1 Tax=Trichogramma pretiosum TaxID=7493 RepID=UPI0006C9906A|nr:nardilysin [Trichogramma pretiosum]
MSKRLLQKFFKSNKKLIDVGKQQQQQHYHQQQQPPPPLPPTQQQQQQPPRSNQPSLQKRKISNLQGTSDFGECKRNKMTEQSDDMGEKKAERKIEVEYLEAPFKSESDKKEYRVIKLPNGLVALLISDPSGAQESQGKEAATSDEETEDDEEHDEEDKTDEEGDDESEGSCFEEDEESGVEKKGKKSSEEGEKMAACALCVGVGSFSDPPEIPGLAHFLEHMVFMGSKKYPEENEMDQFLKKRGGSNNACTDCEQTTFYFEIPEKHLFPAMDRFAQFFISPLMNRDAISRERESVESEFRMAFTHDSNRKDQLFCTFAQPDHPAAKFAWGNLTTLRDNVEEDKLYSSLHAFRERHYSAHRMTLAVQSQNSLDTLEEYVKEYFCDVPTNNLPSEDFSEFNGRTSFDTDAFRKIYKIRPIKDVCQVELTWVMPSLHHLYEIKPHQYLSWIIGHEGKGSLISYLRKKMWCLDIFSGNSESGFEHSSLYALFSLSLLLTREGQENFDKVLEAVFSYINLLRREGPNKRLFDEIQQIQGINFRFTDETEPCDYVENLCENMQLYPSIHYIEGPNLTFNYDADVIQECLDALNPADVNILTFDKKYNEDEFDMVEPYFQTRYQCVEITEKWKQDMAEIEPYPEFHLPNPNIYITDDFTLIDLPEDVKPYPEKIHRDEKVEIWYRPDPKFRLPEAYVYTYLITPFATHSPKSSALIRMFCLITKQLLIEEVYEASAAELNYSIDIGDKGLCICVYGFNQKLPLLLKTVLKHIANCHNGVTEALFNIIKEEVIKDYYNTFIKPSQLGKEVRLSILTTGGSTSLDCHRAAREMTYEDFLVFAKDFTDHFYVKSLIQGNMKKEQALKTIFEAFEPLNYLPILPNTFPRIQVHEIPNGEKCCRVQNFNKMDVNSVVTNYYQSGLSNLELSVLIEFLLLNMDEPVFNQLRTIEQLGYHVFCQFKDTYNVLGYSVTVCTQANNFKVDYVDERIEKFIQDMINMFKTMKDEDFELSKESLIKLKMIDDIQLKEEVDRNWGEIRSGHYMFDRLTREIELIKKLTAPQVLKWLIDHSVGGCNFKKLTVQVVGNVGLPLVVKKSDEETDDETDDKAEDKTDEKTETVNNPQPSLTEDYSLTYLTDERETLTPRPEEYYITDINQYKEQLPVWRTTHLSRDRA